MVVKRKGGSLIPKKMVMNELIKQLNKPITIKPLQILQKTKVAGKLGLPTTGAGFPNNIMGDMKILKLMTPPVRTYMKTGRSVKLRY